MDFIVAVSESERERGELNPATARAAYAALANLGAVILRGAFAIQTIDGLRDEFAAQFGGLNLAGMKALADQPPPTAVTEVGQARFEIVLRMAGAFGAHIYANPAILKLLAPLMGGDVRLSGFTAVASFPGADFQRMHRDHAHLFGDRGVGPQLPVYAVNVAVPLIDVDEQTGPTALWAGSHRWPDGVQPPPNSMAVVPFQRGDAILIDYRTAHAGMPNQSAAMRPILYMVYARPWFFDDVNHPARSPLNMDLAEFANLPDDTKPLLLRAYAQSMRARFLAGHTSEKN